MDTVELIALPHLCAARCESVDHVRALIRAGIAPEPSARLDDGTELVPVDFLAPAQDPAPSLPEFWQKHLERELRRFRESQSRVLTTFTPERTRKQEQQLMRMGSAAWGAALALLMQDRTGLALKWFDRSAICYRRSLAHADPGSWGRSIGALKARVLACDKLGAQREALWTLELGAELAGSMTATYAACLSLLVLGNDTQAGILARQLLGRDGFLAPVADALVGLASADRVGYGYAIAGVLDSFETRTRYLEAIPVADTVMVLQLLAVPRGFFVELESKTLPSWDVLLGTSGADPSKGGGSSPSRGRCT